ncbi:restriction endonuclease subunit S [Agilicoccus flavus]|uniref:restriction endonuclease subunit S n=1 Tax=Agilicoccus flavus TaxID=2775968 RepID=UPI001CF6BC3E|nr:restriction endonuclease subunit S [Agilicoccus flavus]
MSLSAVKTAGDVGTFKGGSGFPTRFQGAKAGELPFFKVSDMNLPGNEVFMRRANNYISEDVRKKLGATRIPAGAIIFAKVGAAVFLERKRILTQDSCIDNNMSAFIVDPAQLDERFAHYLLTAFRLSALVATTALPSLNSTQLRSIPLRIPTNLDEQCKIAGALADTDDLIHTLDRQIRKKRSVKQGMMQELLTGRTRLPGFGRPWTEQSVSELLEFKNGLNKASEFFGHGTPIVNFMDVMRSPVITAERVKGLVSLGRDEIARFSARRGDMFFTRTSESVEEIGTAAVLVEDIRDAVFSGFVLRGRPIAPVNTTFLAYQFQLPSVRRQVIATASYTTRALTNGGSLGRVKVLVPAADEQAAVVAVLADTDAQLAALEQRLESARAIKTGMMQELLTGRTRLAVEAAL